MGIDHLRVIKLLCHPIIQSLRQDRIGLLWR
jgi:hypothetical protein